MTDDICKLLRVIAGSSNAKNARHDLILNEAANRLQQMEAALKWVAENKHAHPETIGAVVTLALEFHKGAA